MNRLTAILFILALATATPAFGQKPVDSERALLELVNEVNEAMGASPLPSGAALDGLIEAATAHPLGSRENPVRAEMPQGQRAYLDRLRCENGLAPSYERAGSYGLGPFHSVIDGYAVECRDSAPENMIIYMDMYHSKHREAAAVPGFTIVD